VIILNILFFLLCFIFLVLVFLFFLLLCSCDLFINLLLEEFINWRLVKSSLEPDSVHFEPSFSILQKFTVKVDFDFFKTTLFSH